MNMKAEKILDELRSISKLLMEAYERTYGLIEMADYSIYFDTRALAGGIDSENSFCDSLIQKLEQAQQKKGVVQDE